jgi:hypothetical protein
MRVSLTKGGKVSVMCSACHFQGFARGQLSDMAIRQSMMPVEPDEVKAVSVSVETAAPADPTTLTLGNPTTLTLGKEPEQDDPERVVKEQKKRGVWDVFG